MTHKAHLKQRDVRCDTRTVLVMGHHMASKSADMNAVAGLDADWNLHWEESMAKNHFIYYKPGRFKPVRRATAAERSRRPDHLPYAEMKKYRKKVGRRYVVPFTVAERQKQANGLGVKIFWELKSRAYGLNPELAERFSVALQHVGGRYAVMTLVTMKYWAGKLKNFHNRGFDTYAMRARGANRARVALAHRQGWITGVQ